MRKVILGMFMILAALSFVTACGKSSSTAASSSGSGYPSTSVECGTSACVQ